jgi:CheY-like chemotaxis protein
MNHPSRPRHPLQVLWQLDDASHWHDVTDRSVAQVPAPIRVQHFHTGNALLMALDEAGGDELPDAILMDFYIGADRGDAVTRTARQIPAGRDCLIIGFSSVLSGSRAIERAGGDFSLPKYDEGGVNPDLIAWLEHATGNP